VIAFVPINKETDAESKKCRPPHNNTITEQNGTKNGKIAGASLVCTGNPVRIDLLTESPNVIGDGRSDIFLTGVVHLVIQVEGPA
jgi:hypothetical protein